ncbi:uncharacterized protein LOC115711350 [Cannabis sativa]|uniref:Transmembrane protein n=1 Tax=Cannabis sativa TaxID=3483 RepID=A0A7J6I7T7_CANSA|nr:uncharacterized protein LOC115711350 [Cannabis sativa]KAF4392635.1 hypothetical protein F8388_003055 [Cannabis sativa]KAF4403088.1 hypothetical protein G4B88_027859 [Cannabis sativa]
MMVDDIFPEPNDTENINLWNFHKTHFTESSMVVIRDSLPKNEFSVFPPTNHENLRFTEVQEDSFSPTPPSSTLSFSSSSSSSFSPSDSDASDPESPLASDSRVKISGDSTSWMGLGFDVLLSKLRRFASSAFGGNGAMKWCLWSFVSGAGIAAVVVMWWSFFIRARLRRRQENLMLIIKKKDEKIIKLLHQIAQLNELLITRHKLLASKVAK